LESSLLIKTIIFDLGGVIVPFDFNRAYARMEALSGLDRPSIRERIGAAGLAVRLESGRIEPEAFVEEIGGLLGVHIAFEDFCDLWSSIFFRETLIPESLLEALKSRHRLLLLSNTNAIHFGMIRRTYPLLRHLDHYVLSYEVGALKPEPAIYREAIRHADCAPEECFFTDDVAPYVEGARKEGIDAVQFTGLDRLCSELRARGIEV
jgi:putative hydrolase of the HAD superfamily